MNHKKISFVYVIFYILRAILRNRKVILIWSIVLDTLNAATRIGAVFALSVFATSMQDANNFVLLGYTIELPPTAFGKSLLAAGVVASLFAMSACFNYLSVILARRMARLLNEEVLTDVIAGLSASPELAIKTVHRPVSEFNRMLTQNGFHYGMMGESLLRMANPLILFVMACGAILYLSPMLGVGALVFSLLFLPIFAKLVSRTRIVAQSFYADQASEMGMGVSSAVLELSTQYGGFYPEETYSSEFPHKPFMEKFLTAFDANILANERMSFAVGLVGAAVIFAIIASTGVLFSQGDLDSKSMITVIGAFVFLMTSTRTVASHVTNLIRFFPQVKFILEFVAPLEMELAPDEDTGDAFDTVKQALEAQLGIDDLQKKRLGFYTGQAVSKFTLRPFLAPLTDNIDALAPHIQFVNASYRFRSNTVLIDLLDPLKRGDSGALKHAANNLGVYEEYKALPNGLNTIMTEQIWNSLTGEARSALRLLPLALEPSPKIIFLDIGVISNLNPLSFEQVFSMFEKKIFFIVLNDQYCPDNLLDTVVVASNDDLTLKTLNAFRSVKLLNLNQNDSKDGAFPLTAIL